MKRRHLHGIDRRAPLGQIQAPAGVEGDVGNLHAARHFRYFNACIRAQCAGGRIDGDRPHLRPFRHGVVKPPVMHRQPPDAPAHVGQAPGVGILNVEIGRGDIGLNAVIGHRVKPGGRPPRLAVIPGVQHIAVHVQPVDETGVAIGNEQLIVQRIKGDLAQRGRTDRQVGKQAHLTGGALDFPDAARAAAGAPLAFHPCRARAPLADDFGGAVSVGIRRHDMQAIGRRGGDIGVGREHPVKRNAEDLSGERRRNLKLHLGPQKPGIERPGIFQREDAHALAVGVDEGLAGPLHCAGKARDHRIVTGKEAAGQTAFLGA